MTPILLVDLGAIYWHAWHTSNRDAAPDAPADATVERVRRWRSRFERIAIALDDPSGSWRHDLYRLYKANRTERPEGAREQLARAVELLRREGFDIYEHPRAEADDVIASLATQLAARGHEVLIATRDKDLHALIRPDGLVRVLDYTTDEVRDAAWVEQRWKVGPHRMLDLLALVGDKADNIPGAPGLGEVTAAKLLRRVDRMLESGELDALGCVRTAGDDATAAAATGDAISLILLEAQRVADLEAAWNDSARGLTPTKIRGLAVIGAWTRGERTEGERISGAVLEDLAGRGLIDGAKLTPAGARVLELLDQRTREANSLTLYTPSVRKALLAHRENLELARKLVALRCDLPVLDARASERAPCADSTASVMLSHADEQAEHAARPSAHETAPREKREMTTTTTNARPTAAPAAKPTKPLIIGAGAPRRRARSNIILGRSGAGKTHFAATIENNFWIAAEDGTEAWPKERRELIGRWRFSETDDRLVIPRSFESLLDQITNFAEARRADRDLPYRHFVVDSLSAVEKLVNFRVCKQEDVSGMEAKAYQAIYRQAYPLWERVLGALDLVRSSGAHVWVVAHASTVTETVAETGDTYQKTDIALQGSGAAVAELRNLWRNWADNVLVIDHETVVTKGGKGKRAVAEHRARVLYCSETAQRYAKTRCGLSPKIAATWVDLRAALDAGVPASDERMRRELERLIPDLTEEHAAEMRAALAAGRTGTLLAQIVDRARGLVATRERDEEPPPDAVSAALPEGDHEEPPAPTAVEIAAATPPANASVLLREVSPPPLREPGADETDPDDYA